MKKLLKFIGLFAILLVLFYAGSLLADKQKLRNDVIRLHVVANSDSAEDQNVKLAVRDAIIAYLQQDVATMQDAREAKEYLSGKLADLETVANDTLRAHGQAVLAKVSLTEEMFGFREYDTFSLPSGIYDSLCVKIGNAAGKNWWCVIFPSLCLPATQDGFADTAVAAGFHEELTNTLSGTPGYEVRFFFLDYLGKLEKFFSFS